LRGLVNCRWRPPPVRPIVGRSFLAEDSTSEGANPRILPFNLSQLQDATGALDYDRAWDSFIAEYSDVLVHTCRSVVQDRDIAMDAYAHALDALREDGCRRLRTYVPDPKIRFGSWLVVVTRRLVLDYIRHRYGRSRSSSSYRRDDQRARRRLEDLLAEDIDPDLIVDESHAGTDASIRRQELASALADAVNTLEPADRLLLALRFEDDRSPREIATTLGLPTVFHVYRRLNTTLTKLRSALRARGVEEPDP
jgi:RNA polymerase sigma factor (sigma-70 family)